MSRAYPFILAAFMFGCAAPVPQAQVCPIPSQWSLAEEQALAASLAPLDPSSPIWAMEHEWQRLRAEAKACRGN